ncbi:MAG TPA: hypothetical protein VMU38_11935 [Candidatus Binatia bacterium]|nr:hypothetical protein [Candidatus Binatia bacterium]
MTLTAYVFIFAAVAVTIHSIFRKFVPADLLIEQHEVAGFLVSVVGVLYSVVLGFLVAAVWGGFTAAQQTTDLEAGYLSDAFNFAGQVREPSRERIQRLLARYAIDVRDSDPAYAEHGAQDPRGLALLTQAVHATLAMPPAPPNATLGEALDSNTIRTALIGSLRNVGDMRRIRLVQTQSHLPRVMYVSLLVGAAMVLAFALFFGVRSYFKQMAMTALVAGAIGLFLGLVVELSTPYAGTFTVSRDAWTFVIENNQLEKFAK